MRNFLLLLLLLALPGAVVAQDTPPPAEIVNDEGGPVVIQGEMAYTNLLFTAGVGQPIVLLEDQGGFVVRDLGFNFPLESQTLGAFTSDFFQSPVQYSLSLPIVPQGTLNDVDNDDQADVGVMVFAPAYWDNTFGDPFLEPRDQGGGGWSGAFASTIVNPRTLEIVGGHYVVYAPEPDQGFPSGFGDDEMLFTEDDPIVTIPQGYTTVDLNTDPFTFDRSQVANLDLLEPEVSALIDYSDLSYTEAFDETIELLRNEYAFTEYYEIDWDALAETYRPQVEAAEANNNSLAFKRAMQLLTWEIPDGHIALTGAGFGELFVPYLVEPTAGGLGMTVIELDSGDIVVNFILPDSPAAQAGLEIGDVVTAINGTVIDEHLDTVEVFERPFGVPQADRMAQLRYGVRFELGETVDMTYIDAGTGEVNDVTMTTIDERTSWFFADPFRDAPFFAAPVDFDLLPSGYGYVRINSFFENAILTVENWEAFLQLANENELPGIIIDMRFNGGGSGSLANQMAGYFFDEETDVGLTAFYDEELGEFFLDEETARTVYPAPEPQRYDGEIAVLVGLGCASACEFFSYNMSLLENVAIVGQYPTAGLGGSIDDFLLPEDLRFRYTLGRATDIDGNIHIEGIGVPPTVRVPVNEETVFSDGDPVLEAAIEYLDREARFPFRAQEAGDSAS